MGAPYNNQNNKKEISKIFNISIGMVSHICTGKNWTHI